MRQDQVLRFRVRPAKIIRRVGRGSGMPWALRSGPGCPGGPYRAGARGAAHAALGLPRGILAVVSPVAETTGHAKGRP